MIRAGLFMFFLRVAVLVAAVLLPARSAPAPANAAVAQATPDQIHLSWVGDPSTSIAVTWRSAGAAAGPYVVEWGPAPGDYSAGQLTAASEFAPGGRGYLHKAEITGLRPDSGYHYRVSGDGGTWSEDLSFRTAPSVLPPGGVVFTLNADVGTSYMFWDVLPVMRRLAAEDAAFHLVAGDLTYADLYRGTEEEEHWFSRDLAIVAGRRPVMVAWGNHDYGVPADVDSPTIARYFQLPRNGRANACNPFPYYSFRYAGIHVVALDDPASPCFDRSAQQAWLREDLARAAADPTVSWKIVVVHRPPFSSGCHGSEALNRYPEFDQYGVDLVLAGHDHNYERTWPTSWDGSQIVSGYDAPGRPVYVVAGVGGATTYDCVSSNPWTAYFDPGQYVGFLRVTVTERHLLGEFVAKTAYGESDDFGVVDRFTLTR